MLCHSTASCATTCAPPGCSVACRGRPQALPVKPLARPPGAEPMPEAQTHMQRAPHSTPRCHTVTVPAYAVANARCQMGARRSPVPRGKHPPPPAAYPTRASRPWSLAPAATNGSVARLLLVAEPLGRAAQHPPAGAEPARERGLFAEEDAAPAAAPAPRAGAARAGSTTLAGSGSSGVRLLARCSDEARESEVASAAMVGALGRGLCGCTAQSTHTSSTMPASRPKNRRPPAVVERQFLHRARSRRCLAAAASLLALPLQRLYYAASLSRV